MADGHEAEGVISGESETLSELRATRNRLAEAERISGRGSWEWDIASGEVTWSDQMYRVFGFEIGGTVPSYESYLKRIHPDDRASVEARIGRALEDHQSWEDIKRAVKSDGEDFLLATQGSVIADSSGNPLRMIGVCGDVTSSVEAEKARAHLAAVADSSMNAMVSMDLDGRLLSWSPGAEALFGRSSDDMLGQLVDDLVLEDQARQVLAAILAGNHGEMHYTARHRRPDGTEIVFSAGASPVFDMEGVLTGISLIARDITTETEATTRLIEYANKDMLTGLLNRRRFLEELELPLAPEGGKSSSGVVLMLDLDNFRYVNDAYGHVQSDDLLRRVAEVLKETVPDADAIARLGGDEFGLLLTGVDSERGVEAANQLLKNLRATMLPTERGPLSVTTSIGIVTFTGNEHSTAADILAAADRALYEAKDNGRDRYFVAAHREGPTFYETRLGWEERIRRALATDGFELHLQPIIELESRRIAMFEVLLRMKEGDELVEPGAFLGMAERLGLIHEIDRWVVGKSFDLLESDHELRLSVNVSAQSLDDAELLGIIRQRLDSGLIRVENLAIEVTESAAIVNLDLAEKFATAIRDFGCGFALDDFGTGFGSFAYLKRLPADYLKIDGDFVAPPRSHADDCVIEAIVGLARGLEKKTIAEYVEDEETLTELTRAGVDYAQGFHIGRPAPVTEALKLVSGD